jgi:hypothetical protein
MRNEMKSDLLSNIEISEEMKRDIYRGCRRGKTTSDFRFRHSGALMAALIIGAVALTGAGASAAAIFTFADRIEQMPAAEKKAYKEEVKKDTFVSIDEGFSRELTDDEIERSIKLERDYYDKGVFPKQEMAHYDKALERKADELAYVAEDNIVYMPDQMSDEQILQYIDHDAKKRAVNIEQLKKNGDEPGRGMALESTPVKEGSKESKAVDAAKKAVKKQFGVDITDKWITLVDFFENDTFRSEKKIDTFNVFFYQLGLGYADQYQVLLNAKDMSVLMANKQGR